MKTLLLGLVLILLALVPVAIQLRTGVSSYLGLLGNASLLIGCGLVVVRVSRSR